MRKATSSTLRVEMTAESNDTPLTMTYNGTVYYCIANLLGDVTGLQRVDGGNGAKCAYDAWGNILSKTGTLVS